MIYSGSIRDIEWKISTNELPKWARTLPVWDKVREIVRSLLTKQITLIEGPTGSGKSLMIFEVIRQLQDQGLLLEGESLLSEPLVATALGLHPTIEDVLGERVNLFTGYSKEDASSLRHTVGTAGSLFKYVQEVSHIIPDEIHDQHIDTILIAGASKLALGGFPQKKLVGLTATLDSETLAEYQEMFGSDNIGIVKVKGRQYPLEINEWHIPGKTFIEQIPAFATKIVKEALPHLTDNNNMLVFIPSPSYIPRLKQEIEKLLDSQGEKNVEIEAFFSSVRGRKINPPSTWLQAFSMQHGKAISIEQYIRNGASLEKKSIFLCTDAVRMGLSILRVQVSVSSGWQVRPFYHAELGWGGTTEELTPHTSINQELGRAARFMKGWGFYIHNEKRPERDKSPLKSHALGQTFLRLIRYGYNPITFPSFSRVDTRILEKILKELEELDAVEGDEFTWQLTSIGQAMSVINADPEISRKAITAHLSGCLTEMLLVIASQNREVFVHPSMTNIWSHSGLTREDMVQRQNLLRDPTSDYFTLLNVWTRWLSASHKKKFCAYYGIDASMIQQIGLSARRISQALNGIEYEYQGEQHKMDLDESAVFAMKPLTPEKKEAITQVLLAGSPKNIFIRVNNTSKPLAVQYYGISLRETASIHPRSSVLANPPLCVLAKLEAKRDGSGFWLKNVHTVDVHLAIALNPHLATMRYTDFSYSQERETAYAIRRAFLAGIEVQKALVPIAEAKSIRAYAVGLATNKIDNPTRKKNKKKLKTLTSEMVKRFPSFSPDLTKMAQIMVQIYERKLQQNSPFANILELDLTFTDEELTEILGIDYHFVEELVQLPAAWELNGKNHPLTYTISGSSIEAQVKLSGQEIIAAWLTKEPMIQVERIPIHIKIKDPEYQNVDRDTVSSTFSELGLQIIQIMIRAKIQKETQEPTSGIKTVLVESKDLSELPMLPPPVIVSEQAEQIFYPAWRFSNWGNGKMVYRLIWFPTPELANVDLQRSEVLRKKKEGTFPSHKRETGKEIYKRVSHAWSQIDVQNYDQYGLTEDDVSATSVNGIPYILNQVKGILFSDINSYVSEIDWAITSLHNIQERLPIPLDYDAQQEETAQKLEGSFNELFRRVRIVSYATSAHLLKLEEAFKTVRRLQQNARRAFLRREFTVYSLYVEELKTLIDPILNDLQQRGLVEQIEQEIAILDKKKTETSSEIEE